MIYFECLDQSCIFSEKKKSHRSRWLHQILIGEIVISYFYELFNRFGFSLLPLTQILRADDCFRQPFFRLGIRCLFHFRDFRFHGFDQLCQIFFAVLTCLGVYVPGYAFAVHSRREPTFVELVACRGITVETLITPMDDDHIREHTVCCDFDCTAYYTSFATSHGDGGEIRGDGAEVIIKREPNANLINPKTEIKAIEYNFKKGATTVKTTVIYP